MQEKWPVENGLLASDAELLHKYAEQGSHAAFDALVRRHFPFVKSVCLRCLGNRELAEDATQVVFLVLARKASGLRAREFLPGWLFQTARLTCKDLRKRDARRIRYEQQAAQERVRESASHAASWLDVEPVIDDMLGRLKPDDRNALLLRFYGEEDYSVIAGSMGISEEAARMRVSRALNKIRGWLAREGIGVTAATLLAWMTTASEPDFAHEFDFVHHLLDPSTNANAILSKGVLKTMGTLKVKVIAAAALATTVVVTGGVMVGRFAAAGPSRTTIRAGSPDAALIHSRVDLSWTTKLPDGTRIRLANVGSFDDRSRKTSVFGPDGSSSTASLNPGEQSVQTDSILLDQNNIGDARVHTFFAPVHTSVFLTLVANPNNGVEAVMDHVAPIGSRPGTADITLNLSKGPYTKLVEGTFSSGATRTLPSGEVVSITRAMKHLGNFRSGGKVIDVTTLRVTAPSRMVESECGFMLDAIDMDGAVAHLAHGGGYSASTPDPHTHLAQLVYSFRTQELTDAHVRRFRFSYRPIDTVVFRNVAIAPKQTR